MPFACYIHPVKIMHFEIVSPNVMLMHIWLFESQLANTSKSHLNTALGWWPRALLQILLQVSENTYGMQEEWMLYNTVWHLHPNINTPCAALAPMIRTCINNPSCIWICIWIQLRIWICIWINIPSINDNFAQLHHIASLLTSSQTYLEHCIHSWITTLFMRVGVSISGRLRRRLPPSVVWMALQTSSTWNCRGMHHSTPVIAKQAVRVANAGFTLHGHIILILATARTIICFSVAPMSVNYRSTEREFKIGCLDFGWLQYQL